MSVIVFLVCGNGVPSRIGGINEKRTERSFFVYSQERPAN